LEWWWVRDGTLTVLGQALQAATGAQWEVEEWGEPRLGAGWLEMQRAERGVRAGPRVRVQPMPPGTDPAVRVGRVTAGGEVEWLE
jgi:hypothetical protein